MPLMLPLARVMADLLGDGPTGLDDLRERFAAKGLAAVLASWRGTGPPVPITPHRLRLALGWRRVEALADEAGLPPGVLLVRLTRLLPIAMQRSAAAAEAPPAREAKRR